MQRKLCQLKELILALNPELAEKFGPMAVLSVQPINPLSVEYKEVGLRWFVVLPWPQIDGEQHKKLTDYVIEKIKSFDQILGAESFGCEMVVIGGAMTIAVGLREKA